MTWRQGRVCNWVFVASLTTDLGHTVNIEKPSVRVVGHDTRAEGRIWHRRFSSQQALAVVVMDSLNQLVAFGTGVVGITGTFAFPSIEAGLAWD
jgi:hypothetical protein